jgi:hypothetical protein
MVKKAAWNRSLNVPETLCCGNPPTSQNKKSPFGFTCKIECVVCGRNAIGMDTDSMGAAQERAWNHWIRYLGKRKELVKEDTRC